MSDRNLILLILPESRLSLELAGLLSVRYDTAFVRSEEEAVAFLRRKHDSIAAVIEYIELAWDGGFSVLGLMKDDSLYASVPLIGCADRLPTDEEIDLVDNGFSEFLFPPCPRDLCLARVNNAIKAKDSMTFTDMEEILRELPSCIFLKDHEGKYVFSTQIWHHLNTDEPGWTIRGKTDLEIRKDRANALKAMEADRQILETGVGTSYIIEENEDGIREFLELIKRPVHDENGNVNGVIAIINDVTEEQLLKFELEHRSRTDLLTGLLNKRSAEELIELVLGKDEGGKSALLVIDVDDFKSVNDSFGHAMGDRVLSVVGELIRNSLGGADIAGRIGGDEFMVLLRDVPSSAFAESYSAQLCEAVRTTLMNEYHIGLVTLSIGVSVRPDNGNDFLSLYKAADRALYSVKRGGKAGWKLCSESDEVSEAQDG